MGDALLFIIELQLGCANESLERLKARRPSLSVCFARLANIVILLRDDYKEES
jgi:hypothetical protein